MTTGRLLGMCVTVAAIVAAAGPPARASQHLDDLAGRLELTPAGAPGWLARLEDGAGAKAPERLLALSDTGRLLATRFGGPSSVVLGPALDHEMLDSANALVLVHNHPGNTGLSANDLEQLTKHGVVAIVAVAHDGGIYMAARGPAFDENRFVRDQFPAMRLEVLRWVYMESLAGRLNPDTAASYISHLTSLALAQADVIEYRATLGATTAGEFHARVMIMDRVVSGAVSCQRRPHRPSSR